MTHPYHYIGVDIAKRLLDIFTGEPSSPHHQIPNSPQGFKLLLKIINPLSNPCIICEASGGYEQALIDFLHSHNIPISLSSPSKVRSFAHSIGLLAKTDKLDAKLLQLFAQKTSPKLHSPPDPHTKALRQLLAYRQHLILSINQTKALLELSPKTTLKLINKQLSQLQKLLSQTDQLIQKHQQADHPLSQKAKRLQLVQGVGPITAHTLCAHMPELGLIPDSAAASLVGVAPHPRQSGPSDRPRHIRGGRQHIRNILYMAALTASRSNPILKAFYQRLKARGKHPKLILTAIMRKLICLLNKLAADPNFSLA